MHVRNSQSTFAVLLSCGALLSACGGRALQTGESSKPDAQAGTSAGGGAGSMSASDAGVAGASDGGLVDASDAGLTDGDSDASVLPPSDQPWKSTPTPLCVGTEMQVSAHSVWSDGTSVYVVAASTGAASGNLFSNDGHGWVQADTPFDGSFLGVTGFTPGPLVVSQRSGSCGIHFLTNGSEACSAPLYSVDQVAAIDASRAYAVITSGIYPTQVIRYNGTYWSDSGVSFDDASATPVVAGAVAAVPGLLTVTNKSGEIFLFETATDGTVSGPVAAAVATPTGIYTALWAFSPTDVWAGSLAGDLVHFDGASWSLVTRAAGCGGIKGIWGDAGNVYFITDNTVEEWSNGMARTLYQASCGTLDLTAIWGNSASELFITLTQPGLDATACGASRTLWYNGSGFAAL